VNLSARVKALTGGDPPPGVDAVEAMARRIPGWSLAELSATLHPLLIPLVDDGRGVIGLLVWPTAPEGWPTPVVRSHGRWLELLAGCVEDFVRHTLMLVEVDGQLDDDLESACGDLYTRGQRALTGLDPVAWTILKAGGAPWAYQRRIQAHRVKGDGLSALVAAERMCERFAGWSDLHRWRWRALCDLQRWEEAGEAATAAMALPMWTLAGDFTALAAAIGWVEPIDGEPFRRRALDPTTMPADRAAWWMDWASIAEEPWPTVREDVARAYAAAGVHGVVTLISGETLGRTAGAR
jgi:hypothetical protein